MSDKLQFVADLKLLLKLKRQTEVCRTQLLPLLNAEPVHQSRDDRLGKAARHALHRRVFFVKEVARVIGEFELAAKDKILIVVKHAVFVLVAHGYRGGHGSRSAREPRALRQSEFRFSW